MFKKRYFEECNEYYVNKNSNTGVKSALNNSRFSLRDRSDVRMKMIFQKERERKRERERERDDIAGCSRAHDDDDDDDDVL